MMNPCMRANAVWSGRSYRDGDAIITFVNDPRDGAKTDAIEKAFASRPTCTTWASSSSRTATTSARR